MLKNLFGPKCRRCGHKNAAPSEFCDQCGISLAFARPGILNDNRWEAAPDELAVFFMSRDLKGLFSKGLKVPAGMRAWMFQENVEEQEWPAGEYTVESLLDRVNSFFLRGPHTEILITREVALPVKFVFDDIPSAELLPVTVETTLFIRIGDKKAFRQHFMLSPGAVSVAQLNTLLKDSVRQVLLETIGARRLEEMTEQGKLRSELNVELRCKLTDRLKSFGLAFDEADTLSIRHDRFDDQLRFQGSLWLAAKDARQRAEHSKTLDEIYNEQEWSGIRNREEQFRQRYRSAELAAEESDLAQVIRLRELDSYEKIVAAATRKDAIAATAGADVERLEAQAVERRRQHERDVLKGAWKEESEDESWRHTQELAAIRRDAELIAAKRQAEADAALKQERFANDLGRIRIQSRIELAHLNEDEAARLGVLKVEADNLFQTNLRDNELKSAQHKAALDDIVAAAYGRNRTSARVQEWEDKLLCEKVAEVNQRLATMLRDDRIAGGDSLIVLHNNAQMAKLRIELEAAKIKLEIKRLENDETIRLADSALDQKLKKQDAKRKRDHEKCMDDIQRLRVLDGLSTDALVSIADSTTKIEALVKMSTVKQMVGGALTAEQMREVAAVLNPGLASDSEVARLQELRVSEQRQIFEKSLDAIDRIYAQPARTVQGVSSEKSANEASPAATGPIHVHVNTVVNGPRVCSKANCGMVNTSTASACFSCGKPL